MLSRPITISLILCWGLLLLFQSAVFCQAPAALQLAFPKQVKQGETVPVVLQQAPPEAQHSHLLYGKKQYAFYPHQQDWVALLPISVFEPTGNKHAKLISHNGELLQTLSFEVRSGGFPKQNITVSRQMKGLEPFPGEMEAIGKLKQTERHSGDWTEPFLPPTPDCMNSPFAVLRYHNGKPTGDYHKGIDHRSPLGRPVVATTGGIVQIAQRFRLHGGTVGLDHGEGVTSIYIHLSKILVKEGQKVKAGNPIGLVGATGFATGPHLHWGLYVHGMPVNPQQWIASIHRCS